MLAHTWRQFVESYDEESLRDDLRFPHLLVPAVLGLVVAWTLYLVPVIRETIEMQTPWWFTGLVVTGSLFTVGSRFLWNHVHIRSLCTLLDSACYALSTLSLALTTSAPASHGFLVVYALIVLYYGQTFSFSVPFFVVVCVLPFGISFLDLPEVAAPSVVSMGSVIYIFAANRTHMRRQRDRLRRAYETADRVAGESLDIAVATTMAEVGVFLHDMRNAITPIVPNLEFVREEEELSEDARDALESAVRGANRTGGLVERLLATIKKRAEVKRGTFLLREALDTVTRGTLRSRPVKVEIHIEGEIPAFRVSGNPEHLVLVIENLVSNSQKAGAKKVRIGASLDGGLRRAIVTITDDGPGIPTRLRAELFKPRLDDALGSHGLGLPLSRRLVELIGGSLDLDSTGPDGTTFRIGLPGTHVLTGDDEEP